MRAKLLRFLVLRWKARDFEHGVGLASAKQSNSLVQVTEERDRADRRETRLALYVRALSTRLAGPCPQQGASCCLWFHDLQSFLLRVNRHLVTLAARGVLRASCSCAASSSKTSESTALEFRLSRFTRPIFKETLTDASKSFCSSRRRLSIVLMRSSANDGGTSLCMR